MVLARFYRTLAIALIIGIASVSFPFVSIAQTIVDAPEGDDLTEEETFPEEYVPANTVSCFDYYHFGSVQAKLVPSVASTVSGATITFSGTLENANPYPVVDGALYVKIFKTRGNVNDGNGPDVVDQFFVRDGISVPAQGSAPVEFSWKVPAYAESGDYRVATFFTTNHKFNLLGLSFTDDVVGNTVPFRVVGEVEGGIAFDKAGVSVNGEPYRFAAFPPRADGQPAQVTANVRNTTGASQSVTIVWKVYQWDAQREENLVHQETASASVPAGGSAPVSVTVADTSHPVYLVVGELAWRDTKSIIGARFVRSGNDQLRINFPSIMSFPIRSGVENTLFSCLHNAGENTVPNGHLLLTLKDKLGRTIAEKAYDGDVTGAMMGVAQSFTPTRDVDFAILEAKLYQGSELVDESSSTYDCNVIDPALCKQTPTFPILGFDIPLTIFYWLGGIALFIIVLIVGLWTIRRSHAAPTSDIPPAPQVG